MMNRMMKSKPVVLGLLAGMAGVAAMTAAEKLEQRFTQRPNSFVPAHTLEKLLGLPHKPDAERQWLNWTMHWGQGALLGGVRGVMAARGFRGPVGSFLFTNLRLLNDQTLENATGVGAPPWTWPVDEQAIDLLHKAIYAFTTVPSPTGWWPDRRGSPHHASPGISGSSRACARQSLVVPLATARDGSAALVGADAADPAPVSRASNGATARKSSGLIVIETSAPARIKL